MECSLCHAGVVRGEGNVPRERCLTVARQAIRLVVAPMSRKGCGPRIRMLASTRNPHHEGPPDYTPAEPAAAVPTRNAVQTAAREADQRLDGFVARGGTNRAAIARGRSCLPATRGRVEKSMRRVMVTVVLVVAFIGLSTLALAAVRFVDRPALNDNGTTLTAGGALNGLGASVVTVRLQATGTASVTCHDEQPGGQNRSSKVRSRSREFRPSRRRASPTARWPSRSRPASLRRHRRSDSAVPTIAGLPRSMKWRSPPRRSA